MKKVILLLTLLLVGCQNNLSNNVTTIIEDNNILTCINLPITNITKLDKNISKQITAIYQDFAKKYDAHISLSDKPELNVDYKYNILNERYISITLYIFNNQNTPNYTIKTILFDKTKNAFSNLNDIITDNSISLLETQIKNQLSQNYSHINTNTFSIDNKSITFYVIDKNDYHEIKIPLSKLNFKININKDVAKDTYNTQKTIKNTIDINKPVIALTFDDGPSKYTKEILDILKENEAVATFFVIGNKIETYKNVMNLMLKNGNEIGNHSYNHKLLSKLTVEEIQDQINSTQKIIKETTGYTPTHFRPTYGGINEKLKKSVNLKMSMWDIDPRDWNIKNSNEIANQVIEKAKDLKIILLHDNHKQAIEAIKIFIPKLKNEGYQFVTVSELEEVKKMRNYES